MSNLSTCFNVASNFILPSSSKGELCIVDPLLGLPGPLNVSENLLFGFATATQFILSSSDLSVIDSSKSYSAPLSEILDVLRNLLVSVDYR